MSLCVLQPKEKDLGDFSVKRVLPAPNRRMVGPFIFFDHFGPVEFAPTKGISVRPHPHIGIATITYLFEGEIIHRDSLGYTQPIQAGAVNIMTAGKGIVHSERSGKDIAQRSRLHGIQSWMALPDHFEDCDPEFIHYPEAEVPTVEHNGCRIKVIMGEAFGTLSPVKNYSPIRYLDCHAPKGCSLELPDDQAEIAVYIVEGSATVSSNEVTETHSKGAMVIAPEGGQLTVSAQSDCHCVVIGGDSVGERHIWWNFVSVSKDKIELAKERWRSGRFDPVPGDDEWIPLPD